MAELGWSSAFISDGVGFVVAFLRCFKIGGLLWRRSDGVRHSDWSTVTGRNCSLFSFLSQPIFFFSLAFRSYGVSLMADAFRDWWIVVFGILFRWCCVCCWIFFSHVLLVGRCCGVLLGGDLSLWLIVVYCC